MSSKIICIVLALAILPHIALCQSRSKSALDRISELEDFVFGTCKDVVRVDMVFMGPVSDVTIPKCSKRGTPCLRISRTFFKAKTLIAYPPDGGQAFKVRFGGKYLEETFTKPTIFIVRKNKIQYE